MLLKIFQKIPGSCRAPELALLLGLFLAGCNYGFQGGGGFPPHIRTLYIAPFENRTVHFEIQSSLFEELLTRLPRELGVRPGGQAVADAVLRGEILQYDDVIQSFRPGASPEDLQGETYQVQIAVAATLIDARNNVILWESRVTGRGAYDPAVETREQGRARAITQLIQEMVNGAQSQW